MREPTAYNRGHCQRTLGTEGLGKEQGGTGEKAPREGPHLCLPIFPCTGSRFGGGPSTPDSDHKRR